MRPRHSISSATCRAMNSAIVPIRTSRLVATSTAGAQPKPWRSFFQSPLRHPVSSTSSLQCRQPGGGRSARQRSARRAGGKGHAARVGGKRRSSERSTATASACFRQWQSVPRTESSGTDASAKPDPPALHRKGGRGSATPAATLTTTRKVTHSRRLGGPRRSLISSLLRSSCPRADSSAPPRSP